MHRTSLGYNARHRLIYKRIGSNLLVRMQIRQRIFEKTENLFKISFLIFLLTKDVPPYKDIVSWKRNFRRPTITLVYIYKPVTPFAASPPPDKCYSRIVPVLQLLIQI